MKYLSINNALRIAYVHQVATDNSLPAVMFLGGFKSDMEGTKALFLEEKCKARGQEFVRFDYTGHGKSDGKFEDGTIGQWKNDACYILDNIVQSPGVILVGSSMGGWLSLLLLLEQAERVKGLIGIAAAPDFTKEIKERLSEEQYGLILKQGRIEIPNDYSEEPYVFTRDLIVDGAEHCVLDKKHNVDAKMILLQGKQDVDVPWEKAIRIQESFNAPQCDVIFIDDGDHRLSRQEDLDLLWEQVLKLS